MSPLWRDEVGIFLGPSKVVLARVARGVRPKLGAEQGISVDSNESGCWQVTFDVLARQLEDPRWQDANVRVVISDHWARYTVLPWSPELSSEPERIAHARLLLTNTYGDVIDHWKICLSSNRPGASAIVSAISNDMLLQLEELLRLSQLRLVSLQPHLIVSYNAWREKLPETAAWFASIDEGSLVAMHLTGGRCDRVRAVRISDDWSAELRRIQTMGRLAQRRADEGPVFVDAPTRLRAVADKSDASVEWLDETRKPQNIADAVSALKGLYS